MSKLKRIPKGARRRYAQLILRHAYNAGGRDRYIPIREVEHVLGLEFEIIYDICERKLLSEVQLSWRLSDEIADSYEVSSPLERALLRRHIGEWHLRIRPAAVRWADDEL